jgi:hypothetical protein
MSRPPFQISGRVVNAKTGRGIQGLRVEAWDKDLAASDLVGVASTDAGGAFRIEFERSYFRELFLDRRPDLFFKVFRGGELVKSTEESVLWNAGAGEKEVVIEVDGPAEEAGEHERRFVVRGQVRRVDGGALRGVTVRAFDVDLRAEQLLGEARSDEEGRYEIGYSAGQFRRAEKGSADLRVRAYGGGGAPSAESPVIFNAKPVEVLDLVPGGEASGEGSEYERLVRQLAPALEGLPLAELTEKDIEFLAGEAAVDGRQVGHLVAASRWSRETAVPAQAFYALLRNGLPDSLPELLAADARTQRRALEAAVSNNTIPAWSLEDIDRIVGRLHQLLVRQIVEQGGQSEGGALGGLLRTTDTSPEQQGAFISTFLKRVGEAGEADGADDFWDELRRDERFTPEAVEDIRFTMQLGVITLSHVPLVEALREQHRAGRIASLRDLARFDTADWEGLIRASSRSQGGDLPAGLPGEDAAEKIRSYASKIARAVERQFPTAVIASRLEKDSGFALPHKEDVLTFLRNRPDFELASAHVTGYVEAHGDAALKGVGDKRGMTEQLEAMQRVAHLAQGYDEMRALISGGLDSAHSITRLGPEEFVNRYAPEVGGVVRAREVYEAAEQKVSEVHAVFVDIGNSYAGTGMRVLPDRQPSAAGVPDLEALFGSLDYCACDECRSVLSPAAYLVDVLEFLRQRGPGKAGASALEVLLRRRPDLGVIELSCANSNTPVPYIDLVNELLENAVAPVVEAGEWRSPSLPREKRGLFQTGRSPAELAAYPEHMNAEAYALLRSAVYPWALPFDLWAEEIRAYLSQLDTSRAALIAALRPPADPADPSAVAVARDTLGLSPAAWQIIAGESTTGVRVLWGQRPHQPPDDLGDLKTFLDRAGLSHAELTELLLTRFVNPGPPARAVEIVPEDGCDLDEMRLTGLTTDEVLGRTHRFVRLWRVLGWPVRDLDRAISVLGGGGLSARTLVGLSDLSRVQAALRLPLAQVLSFWSPLDTGSPEALYHRLFWNPAARGDLPDPAFDPARLPADDASAARDAGAAHISEHARPILAALNLTPKDLTALLRALALHAPADEPADAPLTLANLSFLYRHARLSRALGLSVEDLLTLKALSGIDPFNPSATADTLRFVEAVGAVRGSGFGLDELAYLFLIPTRGASPLAPSREAAARAVENVRTILRRVQEDTEVTQDAEGEQTRRFLAMLNWGPTVIESLVGALSNRHAYETPLGELPRSFTFPEPARAKASYDRQRRVLRFQGVMSTAERDVMVGAAAAMPPELRPEYTAAVGTLYDAPRQFILRAVAAFAYQAPLGSFPPDARVPPEMSARLTYDVDARALRFAGMMTRDEHALLRGLSRDADYVGAIDALFAAPDAARQPAEYAFLTADEALALAETEGVAERFAGLLAVLQPYLRRVSGTSAVIQTLSAELGLEPNTLDLLLTKYLRAARSPAQAMLSDFLDPVLVGANPYVNVTDAPPFAGAFTAYLRLQKVALILSKFRASRSELRWLFRSPRDGAAEGLNLNLLAEVGEPSYRPPDAFLVWSRLLGLFRLRDRHGAAGLDAVFALAQRSPALDPALVRAASEWGGWREEDVRALKARWGLGGGDFMDERVLSRLSACCDLLARLGVSAEECWSWTEPDLGPPERARRVAESVRQAVKARYDEEQWLAVARPLRDRLRERQAAALSAYLIAHTYGADGRRAWRDTNDLYAHFLVDVEMSACQPTSRIRLAHSTVQLFVQRCLMNLEEGVRADAEADGGWRQWEWMKNYRVWEANRKVFLYPENWIEPELRDDKTEFFAELENELLQNDLTAETAEAAYANYLEKLDSVARLEVCAVHRQQQGAQTILHVFGRTRGTPHVYYYRRRVTGEYVNFWTPWEKLNVDIEGDHLLPVVWNERLYLFWPTFIELTEREPVKVPAPEQEIPEPPKYSKMQLAWSQYRNNKWTAKTISKEFAKVPAEGRVELYFQSFPVEGGDLTVRCLARIRPVSSADLRAWDAFDSIGGTGVASALRSVLIQGLRALTVAKHIDFRFANSDGVVRRLPMRDGPFTQLLPGTHLEGMTFVENGLLAGPVARAEGYALLPLNAPEGSADVNDGWAAPGTTGGAAPLGQTYLLVRELELRSDDRLVLDMPSGPQTVLRRLPREEGEPNSFRVLLPPQDRVSAGRSPVFDFFYQDNSRTFLATLKADAEVLRDLTARLEQARPGSAEYWLALFLLSFVLPGSMKYQFQSHYHPYARLLTQRLNTSGVDGLLQRWVQVAPHRMKTPPLSFDFAGDYRPDAEYVDAAAYPVEEIDFKPEGAYAQYNWEMFFHAPFLTARKLSQNQRFAEAQRWFHTIFDPTDTSGEEAPQRYWRMRHFYETTQATYQEQRVEELLRALADGGDPRLSNLVGQWREHPFNPHFVARTRTTAFQKAVVMKYLDNLIAWGDHLFRQDTSESVGEATQLYVLAAEILGPRPQRIRPRSSPPAETYYEIAPRLDSFANARVRLENLTPPPAPRRAASAGFRPEDMAGVYQTPERPSLSLASDLYFCIPPNAKLLAYWDTVADRLLKVRHCMNIEGLESQRPLFESPLDPGMLIRAGGPGGDARPSPGEAGGPLSHYRFTALLQMASELCAEVRGFGAALLSALEKRDAEALALLRSGQEIDVLTQMRQIREQQLEEASLALEALEKTREIIDTRRSHYAGLAFLSPGEALHLRLMAQTLVLQSVASGLELTGSLLHLVPDFKIAAPTSIGSTFGGRNLGTALEVFARYLSAQSSIVGTVGSMGATLAGYARRGEEWGLQVRLADKELEQVDRQIAAARVRLEVLRQELRVHDLHTRHAREADAFMRNRYTNRELYDWMAGQLSAAYFQSYQLAYDMARRAERAYHFERGVASSNFIRFGYWDSLRKGLLAGERLQLDLRRLEVAYVEQNRREYELTRQISLALLDPFALHQLRTTGACAVTLPESLFDHDHPGHYMRRIKSVSLTLPAVVGPYTSVNCRLTLQSSAVRVDPTLLGGSRYLPDPDPAADPRFRLDLGSVQSISTSRAHSDAGLFEVNFRDERYLPFEGAGAVSTWLIELDPRCNDFDLGTLSDVIIELRYTAREGGRQLRERCLEEVVANPPRPEPRGRLFSARTDFADAWNDFLYPFGDEPGQTLRLDLDRTRFPFRAQQGEIELTELHVVLVLGEAGRRHYPADGIKVVIRDPRGNAVTPPPPPPPSTDPGGLPLRAGGDPGLGAAPGGFQPLSAPGGQGSWLLTIPQAVVERLPTELRAPAAPGTPARLAPEMLDDLLLFAVYEVRARR